MGAKLDYKWESDDSLELIVSGDCVALADTMSQEDVFKQLNHATLKKLTISTKCLGKWDTTLVVFLYTIIKKLKTKNVEVDLAHLPDGLKSLLNLAFSTQEHTSGPPKKRAGFFERIGEKTLSVWVAFKSGLCFLGDSFKSIGRYFSGKAITRKVDFQFALEDCGYKALPIVALISFMVGLILSFVGAMQLKLFGAQIFVASLVAIGMMRVMGAMMTGIIMAGRTGSAYAATIGTMQVNEEIDAMQTMGIKVIDFLLLPRVLALTFMMPLLVVFSDVVGMLGGAFVGILFLDLPVQEYWNATVAAMRMKDFLVGLTHGFVFGIIIALCGCYCGIKSGKDADAVGKSTTSAVVYSIVWIILATAVLTVIFQVLGI